MSTASSDKGKTFKYKNGILCFHLKNLKAKLYLPVKSTITIKNRKKIAWLFHYRRDIWFIVCGNEGTWIYYQLVEKSWNISASLYRKSTMSKFVFSCWQIVEWETSDRLTSHNLITYFPSSSRFQPHWRLECSLTVKCCQKLCRHCWRVLLIGHGSSGGL